MMSSKPKKTNFVKVTTITVGVFLLALITLVGLINLFPSQRNNPNSQSYQQSAAPAEQKTSLEDLRNAAGIDTTIFVANSKNLQEAQDLSQAPFKLVINASNVLSCSDAKIASYDIFKKLYTQDAYKSLVDQVVVTYPKAVATSLNSQTASQENLWTGPTNFYTYLFSNYQVSQSNPMDKTTWVVDLGSCK